MTPALAQAERTIFMAIEILATSTDMPEERLRSAWVRVQQVVLSDLPARLVPAYQALHTLFAHAFAAEGSASGLPLSRLAYIELSTALCAFYRRMHDAREADPSNMC